MKIPRMHRALLVLFALWTLGAAAPGPAGAKDAPPPPPKSIRVAILPIVNESPDPGATKIMEDILKDQFADIDKSRATFLLSSDVERILTGHNAIDRAYRINDLWSKTAKLDSTDVVGLDSLLLVDDILCVKVSEWENVTVHQLGAGQSNTTVGLAFALFGIQSKKLIWSKSPREQRFAREIDTSTSSVGYDGSGVIQTAGATDPPRYEDVASDLVRTAFKKFPEK